MKGITRKALKGENLLILTISMVFIVFTIIVGVKDYEKNQFLWKVSPIHIFRNLSYLSLFFYLRNQLDKIGYVNFICSFKSILKLLSIAILLVIVMTYLGLEFKSQFRDSIESIIQNSYFDIDITPYWTQIEINLKRVTTIHVILHIQFLLNTFFTLGCYFLVRKAVLDISKTVALSSWVRAHGRDIISVMLIPLAIAFIALIVYFIKADYFITLRSLSNPLMSSFFIGTLCVINTFWVYQVTPFNLLGKRILGGTIISLFLSYLLTLSAQPGVPYAYSSYNFLAINSWLSHSISGLILGHVISMIYFLIRKNAIKKQNQLALQYANKSSELSFLKSQINPHFLFNSLNTIYGLALEEESPKSAEGVQKLSDMMRFMLRENTEDKILLTQEIKYINNYIDFQMLKTVDNPSINLDIDISDHCEGEIAPMLLIPMIENAFKHGISMNSPSWIKIKLTCNQADVYLNVKNSIHSKQNGEINESGIGLENVRKRLAILYPSKHLFQIYENTESFEANIKVNLS